MKVLRDPCKVIGEIGIRSLPSLSGSVVALSSASKERNRKYYETRVARQSLEIASGALRYSLSKRGAMISVSEILFGTGVYPADTLRYPVCTLGGNL